MELQKFKFRKCIILSGCIIWVGVSFEWSYCFFFRSVSFWASRQLDAKCVILLRFARFRSKMNTLAFEIVRFCWIYRVGGGNPCKRIILYCTFGDEYGEGEVTYMFFLWFRLVIAFRIWSKIVHFEQFSTFLNNIEQEYTQI